MITGTLLAFLRPGAPGRHLIRGAPLTFAERVAYQRAIEDVYWRHRIWPKEHPNPKPSLDAVMSQAQMEKKVQDYLRNSQALEDYWQRPITAEQLQAEMDRMAQHTKQPEVLRELFEALGNDPFVIAECLARPVLVRAFDGKVLRSRQRSRWVSNWARAQDRDAECQCHGARLLTTRFREYRMQPSGCVDNWAATSTTNAPTGRYDTRQCGPAVK